MKSIGASLLAMLICVSCSLHNPVRDVEPGMEKPHDPVPEPPTDPSGVVDEANMELVEEWLAAMTLTEPLLEPAVPEDVVEGLEDAELPLDDDEWVLDADDFDFPVLLNDQVLFWKEYFSTRIPERFALYLTRMGRYEPLISHQLRQRGMPQDLIFLALIESGFSPVAYSPAHAVGVWQFIAATGRRYGLEVSHYIDERRDPVRATEAALDYLEDLYERFGSWYLAAASYNTGENRVERLLRTHADGARGDDDLFWQIRDRLPRETREYVPKIIAAAILGRHADHFGFGEVEPEPAESFEVVTVPDATDLGVIAGAAGVDVAEVKALNPHFLRDMTPPGRAVQVRLPPGRGEAFTKAYALIPPDERVQFIEHMVRPGETLSHIARRYGVSIGELQAANRISNPHAIAMNSRLIVPRGGGARPAAGSRSVAEPSEGGSGAGESASSTYTVRRGDSLWTIARSFGVSVDDLRQWNQLSGSTIRPGQKLELRHAFRTYSVQAGDTLWDIARAHGVTIAEIRDWNGLSSESVIRPGQTLHIRHSR